MDILMGRAEGDGIDGNDSQPAGVATPGGFGHEIDAGQAVS